MERLTQRSGDTVVYIGNRTKIPGLDSAGSMRVAAVRECMDRLAEYEDTGLTPEELREVRQALTEAVRPVLQQIVAFTPRAAAAIRTALEHMTPDQIVKLLQVDLQKN